MAITLQNVIGLKFLDGNERPRIHTNP